MIPGLSPSVVDNLLQYLTYELEKARGERSQLESDWIRYANAYRARPKEEEKSFPFVGAANLTIPVIATDVDVTVAGLLGSIFASPNLWVCEGLRPDALDFAARLEEFLEWAQETELGMYSVISDWVNETVKLGTGVLKQRYRREQRKMWEWRELGPGQTIQQMVRRIAVNRPDVSRVPLANFYIPASAGSISSAAWVGERLELSWTQLENRVRAGIYQPDFLTRIGAHWRAQQPVSQYGGVQRAYEQLDHFVPGIRDTFELFEFWTDADLGDGEPTSVVCTIHIPSNSYARIDFNPFFHQEKPYSAARFLRVEGRFYGIGVCEMEEQFQEEISTMHNQRIDAGTIRNTVLMKGRRGSGIKQDEPIWPGRIMLVDNPAEDLVPMQMGYQSPSTIDEEGFTIDYAHQRVGTSGYKAGGAGQPNISYSTATTTIEMLKQGRLRDDQVLREFQSAITETGQRVVELYQQFDQGGKVYQVMGDKDGAVVDQVLHFPLDTIRLGVAIKTTATNSQLNKETKIRTDQIIFGLVAQFYQQLFQAMTVVVNPQLPPPLRILATQMIQGGVILARRILDAYGTQDLDRIIPDLEQLGGLSQQIGQLNGGGPGGPQLPNQPGVPGVGPGPGQAPGLLLGAGGTPSYAGAGV